MALKDHVADSTKIKEEEIEAIIADFLKYDPVHKTVVFMPRAQELSVEKKVLLHLVALRGWRFVSSKEDAPLSSATPKEVEQVTGIKGGTLRPTLRALVQSRMLESKKGRYEIPVHNFGRVREVMAGKGSSITVSSAVSMKGTVTKKSEGSKSAKKKSGNKPSLSESIKKLIETQWFKSGKTTAQLQKKLQDKAINVPMTRLPVYLIKAVHDGDLKRTKETVEDKKVWVYKQ